VRTLWAVRLLLVAALLLAVVLAADLAINRRWLDLAVLFAVAVLLVACYGLQHWARRQLVYRDLGANETGDERRG
jgi:cytochrome bd-type quinol oxidase subunit 2